MLFYSFHPDVPLSRFVAGQIGIPEPKHARIYLFAAYRYLEGRPLTPEEQRKWLAVWKIRANRSWPGPDEGNREWVKQRARVDSAPPSSTSEPRLSRSFVVHTICARDAYDTAARTLANRIHRFGAQSPEVKYWTQGQDAVFAACAGEGMRDLVRAPASMPPLIRADRDYQIAAMLFYASRYDESIAAFRAVALDKTSPWRVWAPYQIGRAMLWRARQTPASARYVQSLREAETQFRAVVRDPALRPTHAAAERLLLRCMMITDRRAALARIAARLRKGTWAENDLQAYLEGTDWLEGDPWDGVQAKPVPPSKRPVDEMSQWILAFQSGIDVSSAIAAWKRTGSRAWLYTALWYATGDAAAEISDAGQLETLPALRYAVARALFARGDFSKARKLADQAVFDLAALPSAHNRASQLRAQLSETAEEFARLAPLPVIFAASEHDTNEWKSHDDPAHWEWVSDRREIRKWTSQAAALKALPRFDDRAVDILNRRIPLHTLARIVESDALPAHLRDELALVTWTRAILIGRKEIAARMGPLIPNAVPKAAPAMQRYLAESSEQNAAFVLLDLPGARPYLTSGYGRGRGATEHDEFGRNWWFRFHEFWWYGTGLPGPPYDRAERMSNFPPESPPLPARPSFLSGADEAEAVAEHAGLRKSSSGLHYVSRQIMNAVRSNPRRSDTAQVLRRLLDGARRNQWAEVPDHDEKYPALAEAWRLLSTKFRNTRWFREYEPWDLPAGVIE